MAPTATTLYVHRARWEFNLAPEMIVWTAHRPLRGEVTWEGPNVGWGVHFAAADRDDARFDYFMEQNRRDDAREVILVDNERALALAIQRCEAAGRTAYGLGAYVLTYLDPEDGGPREGAKVFAGVYDLPWDDADTSADALIDALAAA